MRTETQTQLTLKELTDHFYIDRLTDDPPPKYGEWASFLEKHPQYIDGSVYYETAYHLTESRQVLNQMSQQYQELGGKLIRMKFTDEQLHMMK